VVVVGLLLSDDVTALEELLQRALHHGITTIDLADVYGWYADGYGKANDLLAKVFVRRVSIVVQEGGGRGGGDGGGHAFSSVMDQDLHEA